MHDCREVGAKDALMEFVLQKFAEKKQGLVTSCFVYFSLNLDLRGNLTIMTSFLVTAMHPPSSIFSISMFVGISQQKQLRVFLKKRSPTLLVKISAGRLAW